MKIFNRLKHIMFQQKKINLSEFMQKMLDLNKIAIQNNLIKILKNCANMIKKELAILDNNVNFFTLHKTT